MLSQSLSYAKVSKREIKKIFSRLEKMYQKDFKKRDLKIVFKIKKDKRINAEATSGRNPKVRLIYIYEGYLNQRCQTYDSLLAITCHELGHHLASKNKNPNPGHRRYVIEGEADYWAAKYCLPKYYKNYPNDIVTVKSRHKSDVDELCSNHKKSDYSICQKVLGAGINKLTCGYKLDRRFRYHVEPSYKTPDDLMVSETSIFHPSPQCRIDTHLNGFMGLKRPSCWHRSLNSL